MMPEGVEHKTGHKGAFVRAKVTDSMMPEGVEHST